MPDVMRGELLRGRPSGKNPAGFLAGTVVSQEHFLGGDFLHRNRA